MAGILAHVSIALPTCSEMIGILWLQVLALGSKDPVAFVKKSEASFRLRSSHEEFEATPR